MSLWVLEPVAGLGGSGVRRGRFTAGPFEANASHGFKVSHMQSA